jgi:anthranilate/para-aminobenzoate synthase component I
LLSSEKDQAELHMIVDLMRNDLLKICEPGSVLVKDKGSLHSFTTVHHLIARITGLLREPQSFGSILAVLCPGGSITGTPKIEVMRAIYDYESRPRDYFMGNIFCWDLKSQYFDSSILIRTVQKRVGIDHYEFAAGSGLVIGSELLAEMEEISAKARVVVN